MTYLSKLSDRTKTILSIIGINLLFGLIGLFMHPGSYWQPLVFTAIVWAMSYCAYIPFAGFLLFYWLYKVPLVNILWHNIWNLNPSWFTKALFWIYFLICVLRTFQQTAFLIGPVRPEE